MAMLRADQDQQVRQLCAVLIRKHVMSTIQRDANGQQTSITVLQTLEPEIRQELKTGLLQCIEAEPERIIRKKVCDAVGQLGITLLNEDQGAWPELLPFMLGATRSGNVNMHESALVIFNALSDFIAEKMKPHHGMLLDVFRASLMQDQHLTIRIAALKALASFLVAVSEASARAPFQELVPLMLSAIGDSLSANAEAECRDALEVFVEIAESQPKFLKKHIQACVGGMLQIAENGNLEEATRQLALEFVLTTAENNPAIKKLDGFCKQGVKVALGMMLEIECDTPEELAEWENEEEDEEDTEITNYDVGEEALDRLSIAMGGKTMVPVLFEHITEFFKGNWKQRHAALMAISQSGEGCEKQMAKNLDQIVKMIVQHFGDQHPRVRWAAINAVGQMSTDFGPELQEQLHETVVVALVVAMDDPCKRVQAHAAAAVINFCEHCDRETLQPYLEGLLGKLLFLLGRDVRRVQEQAVTAVASVADVAETDFAPYYPQFMPGLKAILSNAQGKEMRMLRGKAMECISLIGMAVGKDIFGQDAKDVMDILIRTQGEQLEPDDPQVSFMLQACARICKTLGEHFQPYLPFVIPPLLKSAQIDPELHVTDADDVDGEQEEEEGMESVTVAIRGQGNKRISIRTSALEEKATACSMLQSYAADLKEGFFPYVQEVAQVLVPLIKFQCMDEVRTASMATMPELLQSATLAMQSGAAPQGEQLIVQLKDFMLNPILEQFKGEPDTETLDMLVGTFSEVIEKLGESGRPSCAFTPLQQTEIAKSVLLLLKESFERKNDKKDDDDDDDGADEEDDGLGADEEREEGLVQNLVQCLGSMLKVYRSPFLPILDQEGLIRVFTAMLQSPTAADRAAALCLFDDVIEHCSADGGNSALIPSLQPQILQLSRDPDASVRQAAVYGVGVMAEHLSPEVFDNASVQGAAEIMNQVCTTIDAFHEDNVAATENAVSAMGKLCKRGDDIAAALLPRWLSFLPLRNDKQEAKLVHKMLVDLVSASNTHLIGASMERLPDIICIFGKILNTDLIEPDVNGQIAALLKQVHAGLPHVLQALPGHPKFAELDAEARTNLERAISS
uniref:TOG domain-containing protein n=1 Tax=Haptolina ericina TaxID=156174 RepID=A0A7S3C1U5_9EUKA